MANGGDIQGPFLSSDSGKHATRESYYLVCQSQAITKSLDLMFGNSKQSKFMMHKASNTGF